MILDDLPPSVLCATGRWVVKSYMHLYPEYLVHQFDSKDVELKIKPEVVFPTKKRPPSFSSVVESHAIQTLPGQTSCNTFAQSSCWAEQFGQGLP